MRTISTSRASLARSLFLYATLACSALVPVAAMPISKQLVVTAIQVCNTAGTTCASTGSAGNAYFEAETDKIWAQAGIDIHFVFGGTVNNTALFSNSDGVGTFAGSGPLAGPGTTMWLMDSFSSPGLYGNAWLDAGGTAINMGLVTSFNGGIGRLDTIAHELGHNLGLVATSSGHDDSNPNFLIASGSVRNIPSSLGEICPDPGALTCYSLLTAAHIATARSSLMLIDFTGVVPEPGGLALAGLALATAFVARRRRQD